MIGNNSNTPQNKIIEALRASPSPLSANDLCTRTGIPRNQINFYLLGLKQMNLIEAKKKPGNPLGGLDQYIYSFKG